MKNAYRNQLMAFCLGVIFLGYGQWIYADPVSGTQDPGRVWQDTKSGMLPSIPTEPDEPMVETKRPEKLKVSGIKFKLNQVVIKGATTYTPHTLSLIYKEYVGRRVNFADLQIIANKITSKYRSDGYILSQAILPPQHIKNGVVHFQIVEGFIDRVNIEGRVTPSAQKLLEAYAKKIRRLALLQAPFRAKRLERYILFANDLPGLSVKTVLSPSKHSKGGTTMTFVVTQKRVAASANFNNYGSYHLGTRRVGLSGQVNAAFGTADQLGLNLVATPDSDKVRLANLSYERPIGSEGLRIYGSGVYTKTQSDYLKTVDSLEGTSWEAIVGLEYPIMRHRRKNFTVNMKLDWLDSQSDYQTLTRVFYDRLRSLRVGAEFDFVDGARGINTLEGEISQGFLIGGAKNVTDSGGALLEPERPPSRFGGKANYTKFNVNVSRLQALGDHFSLLGEVKGQYSSDSLLSAEEIGFGGRVFGRAYDPSEIVGDKGIIGKVELRADIFSRWSLLKHIQAYLFYDAGVVWNNNAVVSDQPTKESATSAGLGARIRFSDHFSGDIEVSKPLTNIVQSLEDAGKSGDSARVFFNIEASV
jgi:hemolysin activation/secretion protein